MKCLLSHTDPDLSHSQISDLRPGERDKVYVEAFEQMCKSIMLVYNTESLDGKLVSEMSYLTLYDYVRKPKCALGSVSSTLMRYISIPIILGIQC